MYIEGGLDKAINLLPSGFATLHLCNSVSENMTSSKWSKHHNPHQTDNIVRQIISKLSTYVYVGQNIVLQKYVLRNRNKI